MLNKYHKYDTRKIQLKITINFMSSKDNNEECVMHSKSENVKIMMNDKEDKVIEERFQSLQIGLETSRKGSDFLIDCVHLLYCNCHEINFKRVESYIDSS